MIGYNPFAALHTTRQTFVAWLSAAVHLGMAGLLVLEAIVPQAAPALLARYPDLFAVLNVLLVTPVLVLLFLWTTKKQVGIGLATGLLSLSSKSKARVL